MGYSSSAGCGLFVVGFFTAGIIGATRCPVTVGIAMLFMAILPVVALLSLPNKIPPPNIDIDKFGLKRF
jgi:hypothetical protein